MASHMLPIIEDRKLEPSLARSTLDGKTTRSVDRDGQEEQAPPLVGSQAAFLTPCRLVAVPQAGETPLPPPSPALGTASSPAFPNCFSQIPPH